MSDDTALKPYLWACRRGMLELDVVFEPYIRQNFDQMDEVERLHFQDLLKQDDPDLYAWVMGFESAKPEFETLITRIRAFVDSQVSD